MAEKYIRVRTGTINYCPDCKRETRTRFWTADWRPVVECDVCGFDYLHTPVEEVIEQPAPSPTVHKGLTGGSV